MKGKFLEWFNSNPKDHSPFLTKGQYDKIIKYLKADDKFSKHFHGGYEEELQVTVISWWASLFWGHL